MKVVAFQTGQEFMFRDSDKVHIFQSIEFVNGIPVVHYWDEDDNLKKKEGCYLSDLIRL